MTVFRIADTDIERWMERHTFTVDGIVYRRTEPGNVVRPMFQLLPTDVIPYHDVAWMCHSLPPTDAELDAWVRSGRIPRHPLPR